MMNSLCSVLRENSCIMVGGGCVGRVRMLSEE